MRRFAPGNRGGRGGRAEWFLRMREGGGVRRWQLVRKFGCRASEGSLGRGRERVVRAARRVGLDPPTIAPGGAVGSSPGRARLTRSPVAAGLGALRGCRSVGGSAQAAASGGLAPGRLEGSGAAHLPASVCGLV